MLAEPTAAAIAYGIGSSGFDEKSVLVFDLGGGTCDVSLLRMSKGRFVVIGVNGEARLGGLDMDHLIMLYVLENAQQKQHAGPFHSARTIEKLKDIAATQFIGLEGMRQLRSACERAKCELSREKQVQIDLHLPLMSGKTRHISQTLTRDRLEKIVAPVTQKSMQCVRRLLAKHKVSVDSIDKVVMVGGASRTLCVKRALENYFGCDRAVFCDGINPDDVVAEGAAIRAAILTGADDDILRDVLLHDVLPNSLAVKLAEDDFFEVLAAGSTIPTFRTFNFYTAEDGQPAVTDKLWRGDESCLEL